MNKYNPLKIQVVIVVLAALAFVPFLGSVHLFDWDEINFAEAAREMIVTKNYLTVQINFQPFWQESVVASFAHYPPGCSGLKYRPRPRRSVQGSEYLPDQEIRYS